MTLLTRITKAEQVGCGAPAVHRRDFLRSAYTAHISWTLSMGQTGNPCEIKVFHVLTQEFLHLGVEIRHAKISEPEKSPCYQGVFNPTRWIKSSL